MGRYAQRRIAGGGPTATPATLTSIESCALDDTTHILVDYNQEFTASRLTATDFATDNGKTGLSLIQTGAQEIKVLFNGNITAAGLVNYTGHAAGFKTPDSGGVT